MQDEVHFSVAEATEIFSYSNELEEALYKVSELGSPPRLDLQRLLESCQDVCSMVLSFHMEKTVVP